MSESIDLSRRRLLRTATLGGAGVLLGGPVLSACGSGSPALVFHSLDDALRELDQRAMMPSLVGDTGWTWAQTLTHCAQSIEYSLTGYPALKPALFRGTVGSAALTVFGWRGRMSHDLQEPIPGAPALDPLADADRALAQLRRAIDSFRNSMLPLQPHFAYGDLDKATYERAHAMHLANHFSAYRPGEA